MWSTQRIHQLQRILQRIYTYTVYPTPIRPTGPYDLSRSGAPQRSGGCDLRSVSDRRERAGAPAKGRRSGGKGANTNPDQNTLYIRKRRWRRAITSPPSTRPDRGLEAQTHLHRLECSCST